MTSEQQSLIEKWVIPIPIGLYLTVFMVGFNIGLIHSSNYAGYR